MPLPGVDKLMRQFVSLSKADHSEALLAGADVLKDTAKPNSPVDTGLMKSKHETRIVDEHEAVFEVNTDYALRVEYDQPWIRPAIDMSQKRVAKAIAERINKDNEEEI